MIAASTFARFPASRFPLLWFAECAKVALFCQWQTAFRSKETAFWQPVGKTAETAHRAKVERQDRAKRMSTSTLQRQPTAAPGD
jgi:hypothetical protein